LENQNLFFDLNRILQNNDKDKAKRQQVIKLKESNKLDPKPPESQKNISCFFRLD